MRCQIKKAHVFAQLFTNVILAVYVTLFSIRKC